MGFDFTLYINTVHPRVGIRVYVLHLRLRLHRVEGDPAPHIDGEFQSELLKGGEPATNWNFELPIRETTDVCYQGGPEYVGSSPSDLSTVVKLVQHELWEMNRCALSFDTACCGR